jgi:soluble lytic murein transglycosylase
MRQESRYNPGQISGTNAMGALQMQPETARRIASELGIDFNLATFHRPEVGFRYSGFYMRKLSDTFSGLIVPTASAYNTGPGPIARWFHKNPDATFPWLIEEFEYNEGRAYGRKVAEHMLRYLYLYEPDAVKRGALLDRTFPLDRAITIPDQVGY